MSIPVIVLENKVNKGRYLAASIDQGDWADENLDVSIENIESAFMIWRRDFSKPTEVDIQNFKQASADYKKRMIALFGEDAIVSYDAEKILEYYEPVHLDLMPGKFERARSLDEE